MPPTDITREVRQAQRARRLRVSLAVTALCLAVITLSFLAGVGAVVLPTPAQLLALAILILAALGLWQLTRG